MSDPLVTYALFCYNHQNYIREAMTAALAQNYTPLEIIISDDCSTDDSFEIATEIASSYRGPHTIILNRNPENLGIGSHVNVVFGMASGAWIITGAGDDISDPDRCGKVMLLAKANPNAGAIGLGWRDLAEDGRIKLSEMEMRYREARILPAYSKTWIHHLKHGDLCVGGMSAAWLNDLIKATPKLPPNVWAEDEVYSFWAGLFGYDIIYNSEPCMTYRRHTLSVSNQIPLSDKWATELRRMHRATMRATTWRFLLNSIDTIGHQYLARYTAHDIANIKKILREKSEYAELESAWWEISSIRRICQACQYPEGRSLFKKPGQWLRFFPKFIFKCLMQHIQPRS